MVPDARALSESPCPAELVLQTGVTDEGWEKENSKQEKDLAQIEGQIFPRAKYMNTELLSPNDSPRHVATAAPCVFGSGDSPGGADLRSTGAGGENTVSTTSTLRGWTPNGLPATPSSSSSPLLGALLLPQHV